MAAKKGREKLLASLHINVYAPCSVGPEENVLVDYAIYELQIISSYARSRASYIHDEAKIVAGDPMGKGR